MTKKNKTTLTKKPENPSLQRQDAASFENKTTDFSEKIYSLVKRIPAGKVSTYGDIAAALGNKNLCRAIGNALHKNPNETEIPCFRVVNSKGMLSKRFAFGGISGQKERLLAEDVRVKNNTVDLNEYRFDFSKH